jgi:hypothetical protein
MDRKLHMDTLIFNSYVKNYVFGIPDGRTDRRTNRQTDRDINPVWASLTTFLQVKGVFKGSSFTLAARGLEEPF